MFAPSGQAARGTVPRETVPNSAHGAPWHSRFRDGAGSKRIDLNAALMEFKEQVKPGKRKRLQLSSAQQKYRRILRASAAALKDTGAVSTKEAVEGDEFSAKETVEYALSIYITVVMQADQVSASTSTGSVQLIRDMFAETEEVTGLRPSALHLSRLLDFARVKGDQAAVNDSFAQLWFSVFDTWRDDVLSEVDQLAGLETAQDSPLPENPNDFEAVLKGLTLVDRFVEAATLAKRVRFEKFSPGGGRNELLTPRVWVQYARATAFVEAHHARHVAWSLDSARAEVEEFLEFFGESAHYRTVSSVVSFCAVGLSRAGLPHDACDLLHEYAGKLDTLLILPGLIDELAFNLASSGHPHDAGAFLTSVKSLRPDILGALNPAVLDSVVFFLTRAGKPEEALDLIQILEMRPGADATEGCVRALLDPTSLEYQRALVETLVHPPHTAFRPLRYTRDLSASFQPREPLADDDTELYGLADYQNATSPSEEGEATSRNHPVPTEASISLAMEFVTQFAGAVSHKFTKGTSDSGCFRCNNPAHFARHCPVPNSALSPQNQKLVRALSLGMHACIKAARTRAQHERRNHTTDPDYDRVAEAARVTGPIWGMVRRVTTAGVPFSRKTLLLLASLHGMYDDISTMRVIYELHFLQGRSLGAPHPGVVNELLRGYFRHDLEEQADVVFEEVQDVVGSVDEGRQRRGEWHKSGDDVS